MRAWHSLSGTRRVPGFSEPCPGPETCPTRGRCDEASSPALRAARLDIVMCTATPVGGHRGSRARRVPVVLEGRRTQPCARAGDG